MFIINWIDLLWLPALWFVATKKQRPAALFFGVLCLVTLRLQSGILYATNYPTGFTPWLTGDVHLRGQVIYGVTTAGYLFYLYFSPRTRPWAVLLSTTILIYIAAAMIAMIVMAV